MVAMEARQVEGPFNRSKYPWDQWSDGEWREIDCKKYDVTVSALRSAIYVHARNEGKQAETSVEGDEVRFRIFEKESG